MVTHGESLLLSLPLLGHNSKPPESSNHRLCPGVLTTLLGADEHWLEEVVGPAAQRFGEWASASRTFSAITDLIALVQREVDILFVFVF